MRVQADQAAPTVQGTREHDESSAC
jgi:hypothetical protein